jgi:hypothetical protein
MDSEVLSTMAEKEWQSRAGKLTAARKQRKMGKGLARARYASQRQLPLSDTLPPTWSRFPKFRPPPKIVPPAGDLVRDITYSTL